MSTKKGKTKKQQKGDFIDFIVDASDAEKTVVDEFLNILKKKKNEDAKAKELQGYLKQMGYKVSLTGITKMLQTYNSSARVKDAVTEQGY